jgi:hypothetical protein
MIKRVMPLFHLCKKNTVHFSVRTSRPVGPMMMVGAQSGADVNELKATCGGNIGDDYYGYVGSAKWILNYYKDPDLFHELEYELWDHLWMGGPLRTAYCFLKASLDLHLQRDPFAMPTRTAPKPDEDAA